MRAASTRVTTAGLICPHRLGGTLGYLVLAMLPSYPFHLPPNTRSSERTKKNRTADNPGHREPSFGELPELSEAR